MKIKRQRMHRINHEKGQSLVEFAVSLSVILLLLAGVVDLGRMFFYYISMRDAAQEGVLYGSAYPSDCSQIQSRAEALISSVDATVIVYINNKECTVAKAYDISLGTNGPKDGCNPNPIRVEVADPSFNITMPFIGAIIDEIDGVKDNAIALKTSANGNIVRYECK